jgi:hypothetical protein
MNLYHILRRFDACAHEVAAVSSAAFSARSNDYRLFNACSAYAVVRLHDLWASHCRQLVICSSDARFVTMSGMRLHRAGSLPTRAHPVAWLRRNWTPGKSMSAPWEPDWHVPDQCLRAARLLGIGNYGTVFNALSAITIIDQIRWTRNAIVHSLPATYSKLHSVCLQFGLPKSASPVEIIYVRVGGTGPLLFDHWISEMRLCLAAAIR